MSFMGILNFSFFIRFRLPNSVGVYRFKLGTTMNGDFSSGTFALAAEEEDPVGKLCLGFAVRHVVETVVGDLHFFKAFIVELRNYLIEFGVYFYHYLSLSIRACICYVHGRNYTI